MVSKYFGQIFGLALGLSLVMAPVAGAQQDQADLLLNAQPPEDADATQLEQFDTAVLVTLVDNVVNQVEPAPPLTVPVEWLAEDLIRSDGENTFVPFMLSIDRAALGADDAAIYIRAVDRNAPPTPEGEAPTYAWDSIRYPQLSADALLRAMTLPPGDYEVIIAVKRRSLDVASAVSPPFGLLRHDLSVPDFDAGPVAVSSVLRFSGIEQLAGQPTAEQIDANPYIFGTTSLTRKFSTDYAQADDFGFLFWVYGADTDRGGKPDISVGLEFQRVTADGVEPFAPMEPVEYNADTVPDGFPVADGLSVATGVSLQSFEPGDYRFEITVTDRAADETAVSQVDFTVQ